MNAPANDSQTGSIWVVIPVHNRRAITERCLRHLENLGVPLWARVLVVDDGSTDGTGEMIGTQFPWAKVARGNGHLWWAGAIRLGMETVVPDGPACICWLNDDCLPDPGSLETIVGLAREQQAVCGGVCRSANGQRCAYGGGFIRGAWPVQLRQIPVRAGEVFPVDWLHGNMVAIPAVTWQRIHLPESKWMRHNLADVAYTFTAHRNGIPVCLVPAATAWSEANEGPSYRSWADGNLRSLEIVRGLGNPRVWWYAPGLAYFLVRLFGARGFARLLGLTAKLTTVVLMKSLLPSRWLMALRRWSTKDPLTVRC